MAARKVVIVTGANSGIGYETVKTFLEAKKAYHIIMTSRSLEKGKAAFDSLSKECPDSKNTVELIELDLASDESIEKAFQQVSASQTHLDALVNNAGL